VQLHRSGQPAAGDGLPCLNGATKSVSRYGGRYFQPRTKHHPVDRLPKINLDRPGCRSSWPANGAIGKGPVGPFIQRSAVHHGLPCPNPDPAGYITCVPWRFSQARAPQPRCVGMAAYRGKSHEICLSSAQGITARLHGLRSVRGTTPSQHLSDDARMWRRPILATADRRRSDVTV